MKNVCALMFVLLSGSVASAQVVNMPSLQFPVPSQWNVAMVEFACGVKFDASHVGTMVPVADGVLYSVYNQTGQVVAQAFAKHDSVFSAKTCL